MGQAIQSTGTESSQSQGSVKHLLYPPAAYYDCQHPFISLRQAFAYCKRDAATHFFALLTVKQIHAYGKDKGKVPWPPSYHMRPVRLSICFWSELDQRELWGTVFGGVFAFKDVAPGSTVLIKAAFSEWEGQVQLSNIELLPREFMGHVVPRYYANRKLGAKDQLGMLALDALSHSKQIAVATILEKAQTDERTLLEKAGCGFYSLSALLEALHAPISQAEGLEALEAAKAVSVAALRLSRDRFMRRPSSPRSVIPGLHQQISSWTSRLPFPLTGDQQQAIAEICRDLEYHQPMLRLLSGDVGTGKTLTYLLPALAAQRQGANVGILIPNTLVASQVARELAELSPETPQVLLQGGARKTKLTGNPIVIGTTAILSRLDKYPLHLLICDEQHKMSDSQRSKLVQPFTNVLEATATAVPRTAALVQFGAMDVSILQQCPYQKVIHTTVVPNEPDAKQAIMTQLREVNRRGQIAIVYPRLESTERGRGAEDAAEVWERLFPGQVVTINGKMEEEEKLAAIDKMRQRKASVLVATTVIEVGITLPSLEAILIADPDLLGLAQLHQLRGRVARHGGNGFCFLVPSRTLEEETLQRLQLLEKHASGFALQEADMLNRGVGDLINGGEQTGNQAILFEGIRLRPADLDL